MTTPSKNPAAIALGKLGAKKGGFARAAALTEDERRDAASKAGSARWARQRKEEREKKRAAARRKKAKLAQIAVAKAPPLAVPESTDTAD